MIKSSLTKAVEWFDTTLAALYARYYQSTGFRPDSESLGPMQVDLRPEPPSGQEIVSDRQTCRLQLSGLREDFLWVSSKLDGVLDNILPADVPLCIAPKSGLYDLSSYEVCSLTNYASHTDAKCSSASLPTSLRLRIVIASTKQMHIREDVQERPQSCSHDRWISASTKPHGIFHLCENL